MSPRKSLAVIFRPLVAVVLGSRPYQTCCLNCDHRREPCPLFKCAAVVAQPANLPPAKATFAAPSPRPCGPASPELLLKMPTYRPPRCQRPTRFTPPDPPHGTGAHAPPLPHWDSVRRELVVDGVAVARFTKHPAVNQTAVLAAFEAAGWPEGIENVGRKGELNQTLKDLNRKIRPQWIKFRGNGTGEGVLWERVGCGARRDL